MAKELNNKNPKKKKLVENKNLPPSNDGGNSLNNAPKIDNDLVQNGNDGVQKNNHFGGNNNQNAPNIDENLGQNKKGNGGNLGQSEWGNGDDLSLTNSKNFGDNGLNLGSDSNSLDSSGLAISQSDKAIDNLLDTENLGEPQTPEEAKMQNDLESNKETIKNLSAGAIGLTTGDAKGIKRGIDGMRSDNFKDMVKEARRQNSMFKNVPSLPLFGLFGKKKSGSTGGSKKKKPLSFLLLIIFLIFAIGMPISYNSSTQRDMVIDDSASVDDDCESFKRREQKDPTDTESIESQDEYARKIWVVLKRQGLPDVNIAGILGNFNHESGIDPTSIEGVFGTDQQFKWTERKQNIAKDLSSYTVNKLFPQYAGRFSINRDAYRGAIDRNKYFCGCGLGQYTGPRMEKLIIFSQKMEKDWWDVLTQMAFMITPRDRGGDYGPRGDFDLLKWTKPERDPLEATKVFGFKWEGNISASLPKRQLYAVKWFSRMGEWHMDDANAIMKEVETSIKKVGWLTESVDGDDYTKRRDRCAGELDGKNKKGSLAQNGSIAEAGVAIAMRTQRDSTGNNGSALYQEVRTKLFGASSAGFPYMSCDSTVATAVRYSGADLNFPIGNVRMQDAYMREHSDKWQKIPFHNNFGDLQAGDILIKTSVRHAGDSEHIVLYVGNEAIKKKYPDLPANYDMVSGSYMQFSPCCGPMDHGYFSNANDYNYFYRFIGTYSKGNIVGDRK